MSRDSNTSRCMFTDTKTSRCMSWDNPSRWGSEQVAATALA